MIVALARKSLLHEWRRFLPAVFAVACSALLLMVQAALVLGIFGGAAVYMDASRGDLWVGYPGTQAVELGRPVPLDTELWLRMDSSVAQVEPFKWVSGDWRGAAERGAVAVSVSGIATDADALMFARVLAPALRIRLAQPDAVVVDRADLDKLGVAVDSRAQINGRSVRVVGSTSGLRALSGVNVLTSLDTAARLQGGDVGDERVDYYLVRLHSPADVVAVQGRLAEYGARRGYEVWTREAFSKRASSYSLFETGAGVGVMFLAAVVCVAGAVITSQTLMGAVAGSAVEYATLQALGVSARALQVVVLEQAAWVGSVGLLLGLVGSAAALALARAHDVPVALDGLTTLSCGVLVMVIALVSGLAAVRALRQADPASLLR